MVIRRRAGLAAAVAVSSALLAAGYLWRFAIQGGALLLLVAGVLGVIAVAHGLAWSGSQKPLLVADETGLRVRLGFGWAGVQWNGVEQVVFENRGRLRDGSVAIQVADEPAALAGSSWRSRLAARCNAKLYGDSLTVPFGLTTRLTNYDVAGELARLADGRAAVVVSTSGSDQPEENTSLTALLSSGAASPADPIADEDGDQDEDEAPTPAGTREPSSYRPAARSAAVEPGGAARATVGAPLRRVVSAFRSPARREEVTIAMRREPTEGALALSPTPEPTSTEELPEISQLHRPTERDEISRAAPAGGNVALIIDATTDISARAMTKVRHPLPARGLHADGAAGTEPGPDPTVAGSSAPLRIGGQLREARERLRLSVDDLADRTRIRPFVIECIEGDDFSPCGGDFYARGHLRMLARVLGIASEPLIATYDETFASSPIDARAVFDVELSTGTAGIIRGGASGANWGALAAAVLILLLIWGVAKIVADHRSQVPTTPQQTQNFSGLASPQTWNAPILTPPETHLRLTAREARSARVVVRDRFRDVVFEGVLRDGDSRKVVGEPPFRVFAAHGGVVSLRVSGHSRGLLGEKRGEPAITRVTVEQARINPSAQSANAR